MTLTFDLSSWFNVTEDPDLKATSVCGGWGGGAGGGGEGASGVLVD